MRPIFMLQTPITGKTRQGFLRSDPVSGASPSCAPPRNSGNQRRDRQTARPEQYLTLVDALQ